MADLDRLILVHVEASGRRTAGVYVPGATTIHTLWAQRLSVGSTDAEAAEGVRVEAAARWKIRWQREIAETDIDLVSVHAEGRTWNVESVSESDERQRFLFIEAVSADRRST